MLHLAAPTREGWLDDALGHIDLILLDHAHCEKKAASTAINLIFRYPDHEVIMAPLSELAREELRHFEQLLSILRERKIPFKRQKPSAYAGQLVRNANQHEPERMLDLLICASLIEARSCERMQLLSEALPDPKLARLYKGLLASEARHHNTYLNIVGQIFSKTRVADRLAELAEIEAEILQQPGREIRLHS
jgi:tRNA-(ms[2]io[6]A)-hydroxylase